MPVSERAWRMRAWADNEMQKRWEREAEIEAEKRRPKSAAQQIWPHLAQPKPNGKGQQ